MVRTLRLKAKVKGLKMQISTVYLLILIFLLFQKTESCVCGKRNADSRIVGGVQAEQGAFPWQVALLNTFNYQQYCGGFLINDRWVVTAAHCVIGKSTQSIRIVIGVNSLLGSWSISKPISEIKIHPLYTGPPSQSNDIALIKLTQNLNLNSQILPLCLPNSSMTRFSNLYATGWGSATEKGAGTAKLMVVSLQERGSYCRRVYNPKIFTSKHICANAIGRDVCNGDSGGPLVTYADGAAYGVGVVSWGIICGSYKYPSVFTRVTSFLNWIVANARSEANWCHF